jgi:hypothetical protein
MISRISLAFFQSTWGYRDKRDLFVVLSGFFNASPSAISNIHILSSFSFSAGESVLFYFYSLFFFLNEFSTPAILMSVSIPSNGSLGGSTPSFNPWFHMDVNIFKECLKGKGPSLLYKVFLNFCKRSGFFTICCLEIEDYVKNFA